MSKKVWMPVVNPPPLFSRGLQGVSSGAPDLLRRLNTIAFGQLVPSMFEESAAHQGVTFDTQVSGFR